MNNDKDSSFKRYKLKTHFANACLMATTAGLSAFCGYVFQKTTGIYPDSFSTMFASAFPLAMGGSVAGVSTLASKPQAGSRYYNDNVSDEYRDILENIFDEAGYNKYVEVIQIDDSNADFIVEAIYGGKLYINEAKFSLLDEVGKKRILGHEASHFINHDGAFKNLNLWAGQIPSLLLMSASALTFNPVSFGVSLVCTTGQYLLDKKLSRNIEERADIEGAKLAGVTAEQLEESITFYDKLHCEMQGKKPLAGREQEYPTRKQVIETARMVLN